MKFKIETRSTTAEEKHNERCFMEETSLDSFNSALSSLASSIESHSEIKEAKVSDGILEIETDIDNERDLQILLKSDFQDVFCHVKYIGFLSTENN